MFTGIVQVKKKITKITNLQGLKKIQIEFDSQLIKNLKIGASVAVDGVCLTATNLDKNLVSFDLMDETLKVTTLNDIQKGDFVNIERSFKASDEIGGHRVSGHIHTKAEILKIDTSLNNKKITFKVDNKFFKYIFPKGFIALNGCSLTVVDINKKNNTFTINFIPKTLKITTFGNKKIGEMVNLEVENQTQIIVDTIETIIEAKKLK